ncbi:MAG: hypothetical protein WC655_09650, partial [Candidatus Hydrogenedentales bacterium]
MMKSCILSTFCIILSICCLAGCTDKSTDSGTPKKHIDLSLGPVPGHESAYRQFFSGLAAAYNASQTSTSVSVSFVPDEVGAKFEPSTRSTYWETWSSYAAGNMLDILIVPREILPALAQNHRIIVIDRFLDAEPSFKSTILPNILDSTLMDGEHFALPITWTAYVFVLNRAVLSPGTVASPGDWSPLLPVEQAASMMPPPTSSPENWDDLEALLRWSKGTPFANSTRTFDPLVLEWPCDLFWLWLTIAEQRGARFQNETGHLDLS